MKNFIQWLKDFPAVTYLVANLWMLVPLVAALVVVAVAANVAAVPSHCPAPGSNWLLCDKAAQHSAIKTILDEGAERVEAAKADLPSKIAGHLTDSHKPPTYTDLKTDITVAAREAGARTSWAAALGTLVLVSIIASLGSLWFIGQAIIGHRRSVADPKAQSLTSWEEFYAAKLSITYFIAMAFGLLLIATLLVSALVSLVFQGGIDIFAILTFENRLLFHDEIVAWLSGHVPHFGQFMDRAAGLLALGITLVAILVSSSLYQAPDDDAFRKTYSDTQPDLANYERYLGRSFGRLKIAIYLGAALMVATIAELSAQYAWALSFVSDGEQPRGFAAAMTAFSTVFTQEAGVGFTLFLAALYFPAIVIIRDRARDFRRVRHPLETLTEQDTYLKSQGLSLTVPSGFGDMLALIAPAATAALAGNLFKILG